VTICIDHHVGFAEVEAASRREFLRLAALASTGTAMGAPLLAGCGGATGGRSQEAAQPPAQPTGVLRVACTDQDTFDPATTGGGTLVSVGDNIYEGLTGFVDDSSEVRGVLAESVESTPDAREWTFRLKDGIRFHDGTPLTSSAVSASYRYWVERQGPLASLVPADATYDDSDPAVFRVICPTPFPDMARNAAVVKIISPAVVAAGPEAVGRTPTGTGPFRFVSFTTGQSLVLEANRDYRGPGPYLERIEFPIIPDKRAQIAALRAGDVDVVYNNVSPNEANALRSSPDILLEETQTWTTFLFVLFLDSPPTDNLEIRQAIAHAIDRDALIKAIYGGFGRPADSFMPPGTYGYAPPAIQYPYDPERAKALVAESGVTGPIRVTAVWAPELSPNAGEISQAVSAMVSKIGVEMVSKQMPVSALAKAINTTPKDGSNGANGELIWFNGGPLNFTANYVKRVARFDGIDALNAEMGATPDGPERLALLARMQDVVAEQVPVVPLFYQPKITLLASRVHDFVLPQSSALRFGTVFVSEQ
jgi:peptide/nickel transport system substrate-binding protein